MIRKARRDFSELSAPAAIGLALLLSMLASAAFFAFSTFDPINNTTIALFYLLPVGISASLWGLQAGIAAAVASFLGFNFIFITPVSSFYVKDSQDLVVLLAFLGVAVIISELAGRMRYNLGLAQVREEEAVRLAELSAMLVSQTDYVSIARTLAQKVIEALGAQQAETLIEAPTPVLGRASFNSQFRLSDRPDVVIPIESVHGLAGEIRVWREAKPFAEEEERLLRAFASQGILAIERVKLSDAAQKTKLLEESDRFKSTLLSSVSHDLRTPLVSITGALTTLEVQGETIDAESRQSLIVTAREEADRLNRLVGNLLDMTRLEAGALKMKREPCDVQDLIGTCLGQMESRLTERSVRVDVPDEFPLVSLDFVLIVHVLTNLLDNALKYSPPDSPLELQARQNGAEISISVLDRGIGIPAKDLERVFDKFYRAQHPKQVSGTGLGLAICKGIVEAHGGRIWAENRRGGGTKITISLPVEPER